jgi:CRISPR-associated endonuclease/helicase Cas3
MTGMYSHVFEDNTRKLLSEHLTEVGDIAREILRGKVLNFRTSQNVIEDLAYLVGITHDFGKAAKFFQVDRLQNGSKTRLTAHALLSACFGYQVINQHLPEELSLLGFYAISRHHVHLSDIGFLIEKMFARGLDTLKKQAQSLRPEVWDMAFDGVAFTPYQQKLQDIEKILFSIEEEVEIVCEEVSLESFLLFLLTFSALLEADKAYLAMDAGDYHKEKTPVALDTNLVEKYRQKISKPGEIGELRSKAASEVRGMVQRVNLEQEKIFSITLLTGTGKTLVSLDTALLLRERLNKQFTPKIIYALPYLSIIEQTEGVFRTVLGDPGERVFSKHHSLSATQYQGQEGEEFDIDQAEFLLNIWNSEIILTTFDQLLYSAFSRDRAHLIRAHNLANSVIILDEVQAIPPGLWMLIREFFKMLSRVGNTYIILMTATKPYIFELEKEIKELIPKSEEYFNVFTRTRLESHIEKQIPLEEFVRIIGQDMKAFPEDSFLIVLNTVRSAKEAFEHLKDQFPDRQMYYLSSHIVPRDRRKLVSQIKERLQTKVPLVLVSTQCIEAGVDLDFDRGFRDLGPLESIIQILGRLNREWHGKISTLKLYQIRSEFGKPYWELIYSDVLIAITLEVLEGKKEVPEPKFAELIEQYYLKVRERMSDAASYDFLDSICQFKFSADIKTALRGKEDRVSVFVVQDEESEKIFQEWQDVLKIEDFRERRKRLLQIRGQVAENSISLRRNQVRDIVREENGRYYLWYEHYNPELGFEPTRKKKFQENKV